MQTTRLHISGLTPAITERDLAQRFATFGEVRDVDGVGKLDGLGEWIAYFVCRDLTCRRGGKVNLENLHM